MTRVIHTTAANRSHSAIGPDSVTFGDVCRLRVHSLAPELVEPWNANADAIMELQATVTELTERVWALEARLAAAEATQAASRS